MENIEKEMRGYKEILTSEERQRLGELSEKDKRFLSLVEEEELEKLILKKQQEEDSNREVIGDYGEKAVEDLGNFLDKGMNR